MSTRQTNCFRNNIKILTFLGVWPNQNKYYEYYTRAFLTTFVFIYIGLFTLDFYFLPRQLDIFIEGSILYFTEISVTSKVLTFYLFRGKIDQIMDTLDSEIFTPNTEHSLNILKKAKNIVVRYWKIVASISVLSNVCHIMSPFVIHLLQPVELELPVFSCSFIPDDIKKMLIYPIFVYEGVGMNFHMFYNVNIDTYFWGLMILTIAQLDILDYKLRDLTNGGDIVNKNKRQDKLMNEIAFVNKLNQCLVHFEEISKFCSLIEDVFSFTLFVQLCMASGIICVCLFRFTMPAPVQYYVFLGTYISMMIVQIMIPCWFGTRIIETSSALSLAVYNCDWTSRTRQFTRNLRLFVERANRPLSITGGKMFPLSLVTFTSIMNSAYSFFTLLRHMQSHES